jgi:predicted ATPase
MINLRFVITGGPGAGKTTTLEALAVRGFLCIPESARAIIKKRKAFGLSPRPSPDQFGAAMLQEDMARYRGTPVQHDPVFFDRGVCDALAFLYLHRAISLTEVEAQIKEFRYNAVVFLMPSWPDIYREDAERDQSFTEAVAVCEHLRQWYTHWHYDVVEVPRGSVEERADFILQTLQAGLPSQSPACLRRGTSPSCAGY